VEQVKSDENRENETHNESGNGKHQGNGKNVSRIIHDLKRHLLRVLVWLAVSGGLAILGTVFFVYMDADVIKTKHIVWFGVAITLILWGGIFRVIDYLNTPSPSLAGSIPEARLAARSPTRALAAPATAPATNAIKPPSVNAKQPQHAPATTQTSVTRSSQGRIFLVLQHGAGQWQQGEQFTEYAFRQRHRPPPALPTENPAEAAVDYWDELLDRLLQLGAVREHVTAEHREGAVPTSQSRSEPRRLSQEQEHALLVAIEGFANTKIKIAAVDGDAECRRFALQLIRMLRDCDWECADNPETLAASLKEPVGVELWMEPSTRATPRLQAARALLNFLHSNGFSRTEEFFATTPEIPGQLELRIGPQPWPSASTA
jgi:hypothetical protein